MKLWRYGDKHGVDLQNNVAYMRILSTEFTSTRSHNKISALKTPFCSPGMEPLHRSVRTVYRLNYWMTIHITTKTNNIKPISKWTWLWYTVLCEQQVTTVVWYEIAANRCTYYITLYNLPHLQPLQQRMPWPASRTAVVWNVVAANPCNSYTTLANVTDYMEWRDQQRALQ